MSYPLTCSKFTAFTVAAVIIQMTGLLLFVFGFFPTKPALSGVSGVESFYAPARSLDDNRSEKVLAPEQLRSLYQELSGVPASFDRLILMVIDGLPAEFVLGKDDQPPRKDLMEAMPYIQSLLENRIAVGYHAKAAPPTVTMPRLKALVSGAIGGFLDVAFNFNTQALLDDNLLGQLFRIGWKMVMLGDETWLKLFPGLFTRHDGVSSFYVKDTIQVDQNVSRHLVDELQSDDWNLLILHYLGLDHVGHIGGRNSVLMAPKLTEMDEVVKMIHLSTVQNPGNEQKTLLMVLSDHGMTENGNHGGSSYEETDSLALFIGMGNHVSGYASPTRNTAYQVDIAPTLALLLGVPIPKNNIGVLISESFDFLTDDQQLRALELNSWQLLRLLQAQLPGLSSGNFPCDSFTDSHGSIISHCDDSGEKVFCCLYLNATVLHNSWKSKKRSGSYSKEDYKRTAAAYNEFLKSASEWLSRRVTDKPVNLLVLGVSAMILSCLILFSLFYHICGEVRIKEKQQDLSVSNNNSQRWHLVEIFILGVILVLVVSMGSSSMVEEEQYIWHFLTSTFYLLLLRKTVKYLPGRGAPNSLSFNKQKQRTELEMCSIFVLLISGRILRGWHQGGVNWTNLPDISKWLEQAEGHHIKIIHLFSCLLVIGFGLYSLSIVGSRSRIVLLVGFSFLLSAFLVLLHIINYQDDLFGSSSDGGTLLAQIIYALLSFSTVGSLIALPWLVRSQISDNCADHFIKFSPSPPLTNQNHSPLMELRDDLYVNGCAYIFSWCLLQLLLQQPINSMPILLLLVQILASMLYFSYSGQHHRQWVEVAALFYLGMAGHFSLGNSNTLATIDVAGAFIGLSSHSTLLSGILMFIITYASLMLVLLSMVMYMSVKGTNYLVAQNSDSGHLLKMMLGFPCLVPLCLNSILLTVYTVVLLLMRNHLFVWSVFSPKYLYVCATTVCIYIGVFVVAATGIYTYLVLAIRRRMYSSINHNTK